MIEATLTVSPSPSLPDGRTIIIKVNKLRCLEIFAYLDGLSGWLLWAPKFAGLHVAEYIGRHIVVLKNYVYVDREDESACSRPWETSSL